MVFSFGNYCPVPISSIWYIIPSWDCYFWKFSIDCSYYR